jgi:K+-transporting ATPase KdpF subunit
MTLEWIAAAGLAVFLVFYLTYAMLHPERF